MSSINKDERRLSAQGVGDDFYQAPLNFTALAQPIYPYVLMIQECLRRYGADLVGLSPSMDNSNITGITPDNWAPLMDEFNNSMKIADHVARLPAIRQVVEQIVGKKLKPFAINKVRINQPSLNKASYDWHQDYATWPTLLETYPLLKTAEIYTLWLCLTESNTENGLEIAPVVHRGATLDHEFVENQGYFSTTFSKPIPNETRIAIHGAPLTAAIFGQKILHRSLRGSNETRISLDIRYYSV